MKRNRQIPTKNVDMRSKQHWPRATASGWPAVHPIVAFGMGLLSGAAFIVTLPNASRSSEDAFVTALIAVWAVLLAIMIIKGSRNDV
ncbi:hypothetical protein D2T29_12825 [Sinirhodobacter populi]|uniref:Uncharacterized protein n=1 Tax=Paenirhodobacter populi TaxID=2306993 RepID=A0A443KCI5_9RHOB|nr:hypothetical protein [Sinirhodobacter populi]RWR30549.1 hypothetical protein D2T29_12825 [Sinirhodobacter populi]